MGPPTKPRSTKVRPVSVKSTRSIISGRDAGIPLYRVPLGYYLRRTMVPLVALSDSPKFSERITVGEMLRRRSAGPSVPNLSIEPEVIAMPLSHMPFLATVILTSSTPFPIRNVFCTSTGGRRGGLRAPREYALP